MMPVAAIFQRRCPELQARLKAAMTAREAMGACQQEVDTLQSEYINALSPAQIRVALPMFDTLRQSLNVLQAIVASHEAPTAYRRSPSFLFFRYLDQLLGAILRRNARRHTENEARTCGNCIDAGNCINSLANALESIDRAVGEVQPPPPAPSPAEAEAPGSDFLRLETQRNLMKFFQELAGDTQDDDAGAVLRRARQLPGILQDYGIRITAYPPDGAGAGLDPCVLFDFEPSMNPQQHDFVTLLPALLKDGRVLLRGYVVEPMRKAEPAEDEDPSHDSRSQHHRL